MHEKIGYAMIAIFFLALFIIITLKFSLTEAVIIFLISTIATIYMYVAIRLSVRR